MEPWLLFISLLLLILSCLTLLLFSSKSKNSKFDANIPPGRTGWPFLGETIEFGLSGRKGTPEKFFKDRMKKYSQHIFTTSLLGEETAVICGAAGNKFLFSNENKLFTLSWPRNVRKIFPTTEYASTSIAEEFMKMRNTVQGFLKPESLRKQVEIVDAVAKENLDISRDFYAQVNVLALAKKYSFEVACKMFLSIDDPNRIEDLSKPFHVLAAGIFSIPINFPGTSYYRGIKAANGIRKKLLEIIRQRKRNLLMDENLVSGTQDILSHLLELPDDNGQFMTELEIMDKVVALLLGSQDSTSSTITFVVKYLAEFPQVYQQVLQEQRSIAQEKLPGELLNWKDLQKMKYSWNVVSEVLRLVPPVQGNFRDVLTDFKYAGYLIPKGWKLYWSPNTTHKNPCYFPDPENFDPSRFERTSTVPYAYVPFGGGQRICPGKEFARMVILVFIYNIVEKFKWEKLIPDEKTVVEPVPLPAKGLPIRLHLH